MDDLNIFRFVFAFLFVIGLIGAMAYAMRRYTGFQAMLAAKNAANGARLQVVEVRYLDPKRRLVLVRRDEAEHLLLLGEGRETVIESGIKRHA